MMGVASATMPSNLSDFAKDTAFSTELPTKHVNTLMVELLLRCEAIFQQELDTNKQME